MSGSSKRHHASNCRRPIARIANTGHDCGSADTIGADIKIAGINALCLIPALKLCCPMAESSVFSPRLIFPLLFFSCASCTVTAIQGICLFLMSPRYLIQVYLSRLGIFRLPRPPFLRIRLWVRPGLVVLKPSSATLDSLSRNLICPRPSFLAPLHTAGFFSPRNPSM